MITLLLGGPGETPETVSEAVELVKSLPGTPTMLVTVGIGLEHHQAIVADAIAEGHLQEESEVF